MDRSTGVVVLIVGLILAAVGVAAASGWLSWFGRLPGDLRLRGEGFALYIPFTSMLLASLALMLVIALARRFL